VELVVVEMVELLVEIMLDLLEVLTLDQVAVEVVLFLVEHQVVATVLVV
jgi:hypothetical protein